VLRARRSERHGVRLVFWGSSQVYLVSQCIFKEAGQSQSRLRFCIRVLQFLRIHNSLRVTPAMDAGLTGHIMNGRKASLLDTVLVQMQGSCYRNVTILTSVTQDPGDHALGITFWK